MIKYILLLTGMLWLTGTTSVTAQKKALTPDDYHLWKKVDEANISEDGKWVMYYVLDQEDFGGNPVGDTLHLYNTSTRKRYHIPRVSSPDFFAKGEWLSYNQPDTTKGGKDSTILVRLKDMRRTYWDKSGDFEAISNSYLVSWKQQLKPSPADTAKNSPRFSRLSIWNIATGDTIRIDSIGHNRLYNNTILLYLRESKVDNKLCFRSLGGKEQIIFSQPGLRIDRFQWNEKTQRGTFSTDNDSLTYTFGMKVNDYKLLLRKGDIVAPKGFYVGHLNVAEHGKWATYELLPDNYSTKRKKEEKKPDNKFELELWTWNDEVIQSQQQKDGLRDQPTYTKYIYHTAEKQSYELAPSSAKDVISPKCIDYNYILYSDNAPYSHMKDWKENLPFDLYVVNIYNGNKKLLATNLSRTPEWSPDGKAALIYSDSLKNWLCFNTLDGGLKDITKAIGYPIYRENHDKPSPAPPYGIAGWSKDNREVVIYDRFDMWVVSLFDNTAPYCYTKGFGRKNEKVIRMLSINYDDEKLKLHEENRVEVFCHATKNTGIYRLKANGEMVKIIEGPWKLTIYKADEARRFYLFTRQTYSDFRDLWWTKADFSKPQRITQVNAHQKNFKWGKVELVKWTNYAGAENHGLLYLPEDYDPNKKYPMLVQFYETHTEGMHTYLSPSLSAAMADIPTYVSNGYMVFSPDVHFKVGNPGQSSYDAVVSGVRHLIEQGIADSSRIGLQGHSWSGFQTAYLVTRTNLFSCANIGAPIVDMISGYVGIREGSGMVRFFMYEDTQSRMGKSVWEDKEGYLQHFPLLNADQINTPLLIFHNDADEAVPFEQGRSLYFAMRRLQKPAWLLNYKKEGHFLDGKEAQLDWTIRMQQFFDHYLNNKPMPRWMKEGINIEERKTDLKYN